MVTIIGNIYNFFFQLSEKKIEPFQFMQKKNSYVSTNGNQNQYFFILIILFLFHSHKMEAGRGNIQ